MFCVKCGHRLERGALFCSACGRKQATRLKYLDITPRAQMDFYEVHPSALANPPAALAGALNTTPEPATWPATPGYLEALRTEGAIAAFIVAGATGVMGGLAVAGYGVPGVSPWSIIDAVAFLVLGFGVVHGSRIAGVTVFALFLAESVTVFAVADVRAQAGTAVSVIIRALLIRSFYRGLRGVVVSKSRKRFYLLTAAATLVGIAAGFGLSLVR